MFLPFPVLYQSKIQRRKKVVLLGLFALGLFITVIQIVRIQTIRQLEQGTVDSAKLIMWSMVENNLGIVVSCIPTFAPLVRWPLPPPFAYVCLIFCTRLFLRLNLPFFVVFFLYGTNAC